MIPGTDFDLAWGGAGLAGHQMVRTDRLTRRKSAVCVHCGSGLSVREGALVGTLAELAQRIRPNIRCLPRPGVQVITVRDRELADLDEEMGWNGTRSAIEEANWATRWAAGMARSLSRRSR